MRLKVVQILDAVNRLLIPLQGHTVSDTASLGRSRPAKGLRYLEEQRPREDEVVLLENVIEGALSSELDDHADARLDYDTHEIHHVLAVDL